ncbi:MAG: hypothetical protein LBF40_05135 [Deltaproteobacteria bacterium]|jgi:hypothetical protein|nr:hypothetical protein [Deltaproteobacteria bacterium]
MYWVIATIAVLYVAKVFLSNREDGAPPVGPGCVGIILIFVLVFLFSALFTTMCGERETATDRNQQSYGCQTTRRVCDR